MSGGIDINPDRMWYVFEYFIGGAGNFVNRTGKTIKSVGGKFKTLTTIYQQTTFHLSESCTVSSLGITTTERRRQRDKDRAAAPGEATLKTGTIAGMKELSS